jgi:hypothetical protein
MAVELSVVPDDVTAVPADVLLLKYAQGRYGADAFVADRLTTSGRLSEADLSPADGSHVLVPTNGAIAAVNALFVGVPKLRQLRYRELRQFARRAIQALADSRLPVQTIATTVHGPGYGLDIQEAFRWLLGGFQVGLTTQPLPGLQRLVFVERNPRRFETLQALVADTELVMPPAAVATPTVVSVPAPEPKRKKSVFVAMPFTDEFEDVYQFGIYAAVRRCGYVCEKVDEAVFTGPIVEQITEGIRNATFVIADLSLERPNVYLEVGYAWALKKPVVLVAREGQRLHFDLSHHKCIFYRNITKLSAALEKTIQDMFGTGGEG